MERNKPILNMTSSSLLLLKEKDAISIRERLPLPLGKGLGERSLHYSRGRNKLCPYVILILLLLLLLPSCFTQSGKKMKKGVKEWSLHAEASAIYSGDVTSDSELSAPIIVVSVKEPEQDNHFRKVINYQILKKPSYYGFMAPIGKISVFAFEDKNKNEKYDAGEPCGCYSDGSEFILDNGKLLYGIDIEIKKNGKLPEKFSDLSMMLAINSNFIVKKPKSGEVVTMDHYYFAKGFGALGMWRPLELASLQGPDIFFLSKYDPQKIPILFVHGISGTPKDFEYLISKLDKEKYQPWVYQYPSGLRLDGIAAGLNYEIEKLRKKHGFKKIVLVAHSMGGLVSRTYIKRYQNKENSVVEKYISISSPYGGHDLAAFGVRNETKSFVAAWIDMVPGSKFQDRMYSTKLKIPFHLIYGNYSKIKDTAKKGDGTVSLKSMLQPEVVKDAVKTYEFDEDHMTILSSDEVFKTMQKIIES